MKTQSFHACRIHNDSGRVTARIEKVALDELTPGEVVIQVHYSSINYKDALAATGRGKILRRFPLIAGIDLAGVVTASVDDRFQPGDEVLVSGCGLGESHDGGFSEVARVPADWVVPLPAGLSLFDAMGLGTAGFTAALAIDRLEQNGQQPSSGPLLVTGASGGVGSVAIDLLAARGYEVVAMTRKEDAATYLESLGAASVIHYDELVCDARPLHSAQWGGAIDNVGGTVLAGLLSSTCPWGNIASIGMAGGSECHITVMPFILRAVSVLGISAANCPMESRVRVWQRLVSDLRPVHLQQIVSGVVGLDDLPAMLEHLLEGKHQGRFVVSMKL
ncbi:MAG: YhdH/YhfP family quinone oxidoreductase [Gammaproteobacteria bacterium]|jgi:NADPH2:quinone reductase|nr:YhdH/YhfP family quinone oxidoreductase [Gammaproteobacteria bacterium]